jgi:PAS domain S-box-containing protein
MQTAPAHSHVVQFYATQDALCTALCHFLLPGFRGGNPVVIITGPDNREALLNRLRREVDVEAAIRAGQFVLLDAQTTLDSFMHGDRISGHEFHQKIGEILAQVGKGREGLAPLLYGEMVDVLWRDGKPDAAVELERLWNDLAGVHDFSLFCGYAMSGFRELDEPRFREICNEHWVVSGAEAFGGASYELDRMKMRDLEQRTSALEREIERRKKIQQALIKALQERTASERRALKAERELRDFVENAVEGLHWVSGDGRILWANRAELEMLGYSRDEYVGHDIAEFHANSDVIQDMMSRLRKNEQLRDFEAPMRCKNGDIRHVLINSNAMWEDGEFLHTCCFTRDVTEQRRALNNELFLTAIVNSAEDAVISKTLQGIVTSWNPGAERLFGYTAEEMIGQSITLLIPPDHYDDEPHILGKLQRGERIEHYETQRIRKDGRIVDISLSVSPVFDRKGKIVGASKIARDITEQRRIAAERDELLALEKAARADAERANRLKDEFLAILSHELRTPLTAIMGWTGILRKDQHGGLVDRALEVIERNASLQKRLIEDLLDMSSILRDKMVIHLAPTDLRAVINGAADAVRAAIAAKSMALDVHIGDLPQTITGDAVRLQQVIWNLLNNALKFTPAAGRIDLNATSAGSAVEIVVRDNGEGISPDFLPFVFDRFRQAEQNVSRRHDGLGLGLALVRHIVELHGGSVAAFSEGRGRGAAFTVRLPV